ncbi:MAG TPA: substrate-binding domain-containing protein [Capsulimonadaceae bacterium]|jgi:DNA-binding LacI/PurR family transcriptional regulator
MTVRRAETTEELATWRRAIDERRNSARPGQPLHEYLSSSISDLIENGVWKPGDQIPGHRELSVAFGVSPVTMYKALSAVVRDGRLQRRHGLGTFVGGGHALPTAAGPVNLAVVFPLFDADGNDNGEQKSEWGQILLRGVFKTLRPHEPDVNVRLITEFKPESLLAIPREEVAGFLFVAPTADRWSDIERLAEQGTPAVVLQAVWPGIKVPFVDADNASGIGAIVDHLIALGHSKIACGVASVNYSDHRDRVQAFRAAMTAKGLNVRADYILERWMPAIATISDDYRTLLTKDDPPTALVTLETPSALRAVNVARELGIRIGEDLSLVTFDDDEVARGLQPALTTVTQPIESMAETAILMLLDAVMGRPVECAKHFAPMTLIVRESTQRAISSIKPSPEGGDQDAPLVMPRVVKRPTKHLKKSVARIRG